MGRPSELLVVQNIEREGPGLLEAVAGEAGLRLRPLRPFAGDALPQSLRSDQMLAVLGGPMGVADIGDPRFPWLEPLMALLGGALAQRRPLLGICLGAQLLARAGGGDAKPLTVGDPAQPFREVGFGAISFTRTAAQEPWRSGLPDSLLMLHWHGDRIRLPPGATLLGQSLSCPEQLFRLGHHAFGLQCHAEVEPEALERWIREDDAFVRAALGPDGPERLRRDAERWLAPVTPLWRRLLTNLLLAVASDS